MAKSQLPEFFEKRELLFRSDIPKDVVDEAGERFLRAERYNEALEFFERTRNDEKVREVMRIAFDDGDVGLWLRAKRILREECSNEELEAIAQRSAERGKFMFAAEAYRRLGNEEMVAEMKERFKADCEAIDAEPVDESAAGNNQPS